MMFSIIIPAYNAACYFSECLRSVDNQTYHDYEVVIVDDGSTDSTSFLADEYAGARRNVTVLHGENEGLLIARRRGLQHARGEYVVFLDADDTLRNDTLQMLKEAFEETNADIVSFNLTRLKDYSNTGEPDSLPAGFYQFDRYRLVKDHVCRGRFNNLCGKAVRFNCIDIDTDYGEYKGLMHGEDLLQLLPIVDRSCALVHLNEALYYYRPNNSSSTARFKPSQLTDLAIVNKRLVEYAATWGKTCIEAAAIGEAKQYLNLLKIAEHSDVLEQEKDSAFKLVREAMINESAFRRCFRVRQRLDDQLILSALAKGNIERTRAMVRAVDKLKALLGKNEQ